tara:strand:- start:293 stop:577 length:285 start_codon:yes stop_codon:yes gene_type:complete
MTKAHNVDAQRLSFILNELRLPAIKVIWPEFTERADKEGWPATRLLAALTEHEMAERDRRRIERHLSDARLPPLTQIVALQSELACRIAHTSWR